MAYLERIRERQTRLGRPIRIGLVGAGQMGRGFVAQTERIPGMEVAAIADVALDRARAAFARAGRTDVAEGRASSTDLAEGRVRPTDVAQARAGRTDVTEDRVGPAGVAGGGAGRTGVGEGTDIAGLAAAIDGGRPVVVADAGLLARLPVDMVIDASGVPEVGATVALSSLLNGKDVGLLNVECDVTVGLVLATLARRMGRVYTVCRGDEPVECKRLVDDARDLGFEVVCAGKGKNNPLDAGATPDSVAAEAAAKGMNPKMLASFVDGSKTMIEMAALANATGLRVGRRGFHAPRTTVPELAAVYRPRADGGILDAPGVVDYCTGPVAPGVFVVARCDDPVIVAEMEYLSQGPGPYYTLYRPYHLASVEAPLTIGEAILDREPSLAPRTWSAEVVACAKRDLCAGEVIDGIGGTTVYGVTDSAATAAAAGQIPLGLAAGARVRRDVPAGTPLTGDDVETRPDTCIAALRRLQDVLLAGGTLPDVLPLPGALTMA